MRKSVVRFHQQQKHTATKRGFFRRHLLLFILIASLLTIGGGTYWYLHYKDAADTKIRNDAHSKYLTAADANIQRLKELKIKHARQAEAEAKAKAEADEAARKAAATQAPSGSTANSKACDVTNAAVITVVVNKKHCFNPITWAPSDLTSLGGYLLRAEAAGQLNGMMNDAAAAGVGFSLSSAYRSYSDQAATYSNWVAVNGSQAAADTVSARPGYSEHQTGLAADLKVGGCALECFKGSAAYTWLTQNAANYGFIQRYPDGLTSITGYSPEAWHWRYVGVATATDMKAKGIQTLEQYFGISGGDYS